MLEKTISEILTRYPNEVWPELGLTFVERERRLAGGNILDLRFRDGNESDWIVEIKRDRVTRAAVLQLARYLAELQRAEPNHEFRGMVVAPAVSPAGKAEAERLGLVCRALDEARLREIASAHGLPLDHASGHRPKLAGSPRVRSRPKASRATRPATADEDVASLRKLDERFPPGSLSVSTALDDLSEYWRLATPEAPESTRSMAARLTYEVLQALPHAAVSNRSPGKSDSYTTVRGLDGRVAAAIDARKSYVKFDFPLPTDLGNRCRDEGLLRIWKPRGYGVWCQSRVGQAMSLSKAIELVRVGLAFEFGGEDSLRDS